MLPDEIAAYLSGAGIGLSDADGGNLFTAPFPATAPDLAAFVAEVPGDTALRTAGGSLAAPAMERPSFNVYVRGAVDGAAAALALAYNVYKKLNNLGPVSIGNPAVLYHDVQAQHPPVGPSFDEAGRPVYLCKFDVHKEPA